MEEGSKYLVRGALLYCMKGSHPRRVNLATCHGAYINSHPMIRRDDCVLEENISYFGVCSSETPPDNAEEIRLSGYQPEGELGEVEDVQGFQCTPDMIGEWCNVKEQTKISGKFPAVTLESYLICACGGLIQPITSGQEYEEG